jgi:hypothetical protein
MKVVDGKAARYCVASPVIKVDIQAGMPRARKISALRIRIKTRCIGMPSWSVPKKSRANGVSPNPRVKMISAGAPEGRVLRTSAEKNAPLPGV